MDEMKSNNQDHKPEHELAAQELEFERLMTRIVDDEASRADLSQFEQLADREPMLWKRLSMRQGDMLRLSAKLDREMHQLEQIDVPTSFDEPRKQLIPVSSRLPLFSAVVGWAAVFVMAVIWGTSTLRERVSDARAIPASQSADRMSADDHLREYLRAPWVLGEMPPTLMQVDELSDGRKALRILRRIEEVTFIEPHAAVPVNQDGSISRPLSELHEESRETQHHPVND